MSDETLEELTLESPAGIYALESDSGMTYVITIPKDSTEPGEVFVRREDGATSNSLQVFHARFPLNVEGVFYTDDGEGVKSVLTSVILSINLLESL